MAKRYNLILTLPEGDPVCHQLTSAKVSFGRGEDNRIRVGVKAISSRHCEFREDIKMVRRRRKRGGAVAVAAAVVAIAAWLHPAKQWNSTASRPGVIESDGRLSLWAGQSAFP